ncbi:MAG TPA: thioredoxin domain-containing protein [Patescibacteria group bacterium]|nr:thioredoxin domain-containing protein [Patescibacteria group bacterium]
MSKQFLAILAVIVIIFIGIFAVNNNKSSKSNSSSSSKLTQHIEGQGKAGVTLVEYGDYQCPYCGQAYSTLKQVEAQYSQQIFFQFRNFPLTSLHQNAFAGARAAEAAGLQNKYWEMHDVLYEQNTIHYANKTNNDWIGSTDPLTYFDQYAKQLGLNVNKFNTDYASTNVNNLINADMKEGAKLKVNGTPTYFLDGKQLPQSSVTNSVNYFSNLINAEITKKSAHASTAPAG